MSLNNMKEHSAQQDEPSPIYDSQMTSIAWHAVNNNLHNSLIALTKHQRLRAWRLTLKNTKLMNSKINGMHKEIKASGQKLQTVTNFKFLGAIISDAGSKAEIVSRIAQCTAAMTILKPIWNDQNITLRSKVRHMRTIIISIILYACETWSITI